MADQVVKFRDGNRQTTGNLPVIDEQGFIADSGISINDLKNNAPEVLETKILKGGIVYQDIDSQLTLIIDSPEGEGSEWLIKDVFNQAPRSVLVLLDVDLILSRRNAVVLTTANQILLLSSELSETPVLPLIDEDKILIADILQTPNGLKIGDIPGLHKQDTDRFLGYGTPEQVSIEQINEVIAREQYTDEKAVDAVGDALMDTADIQFVKNEDGTLAAFLNTAILKGQFGESQNVQFFTDETNTIRAFVIDSKYVPGGPAIFPDTATRDAFYAVNPSLRREGLDVTIINSGIVTVGVNVQAVKTLMYGSDVWVIGSDGTVVRWDFTQKKILSTVVLGKTSVHAIISGTRLYVAHPLDNQVSVISLTTRLLTNTLAVNNEPSYFADLGSVLYVLPKRSLVMKTINVSTLAVLTYTYAGAEFSGLDSSCEFQTMVRSGTTLYFPTISSSIYDPQSNMYWFDVSTKTWGKLFEMGMNAITHLALSSSQRYIFVSGFAATNGNGGLNVFDTQTKDMVYDENGIYVNLKGFKHRIHVDGNRMFVSESFNNIVFQIRIYDVSTFELNAIRTFTTNGVITSFNSVNGKLYCTGNASVCYIIDLTTLEMTEFPLSRNIGGNGAEFGGFRVFDNWTIDTKFNLYSNGSISAMIIDTAQDRNIIREKYFSDAENLRWIQTYPAFKFVSASETEKGLVQLTTSTSSTSTSLALTAAGGKSLQDQINAIKPITVDFVITTNVDLNDEFPYEVDGVGLTDGNRVLFAGQDNKVEIGIYQYFEFDTYFFLRATDFANGKSVARGQEFLVLEGGTSNGGITYKVTNSGNTNIIVGTTEIELTRVGSGSGSAGGLVLGETADTAFRGDQGLVAYNHSQVTGNPHGTTKEDLGLDQVANLAPANYPVSTAQAAANAAIVTQLVDSAPTDANTINKLLTKITAITAIVGGSTADGDAIVNTVAELLVVFQTYTEGVNIVTILSTKVDSANVYNALDQLVAGKVLDARQGKVLKDLIDTKAPLDSPAFIGTPSLPAGTTAVTQAGSDNSTKIATTGWVKSQNYSSNALTTGGYITEFQTDVITAGPGGGGSIVLGYNLQGIAIVDNAVGNVGFIAVDLLTGDRTFQLPDSNGTLALQQDVVNLVGDQEIGGSKTFTTDVAFRTGLAIYDAPDPTDYLYADKTILKITTPTQEAVFSLASISISNATGGVYLFPDRIRLLKNGNSFDLIPPVAPTSARELYLPDADGTLMCGISANASLNFPPTAAGTSSDLTVTVAGAADGDCVVLGVPNVSTLANGCFTAWVSAANTVKIRFTNNSSGSLDPATGTFKIKILK